MQYDMFPSDLSDKRVMIGLSGGINSMALLCYLATVIPPEMRPRSLYLFYAHFTEHSPDTLRFVTDGIRYAKSKFDRVTWKITRNSVLSFFDDEGIIPHPIISPCSERLKIVPVINFMAEHKIDFDLVGFVRSERRRIDRQTKRGATNKLYPIAHLTNDDCFEIVRKEIGWYPGIYDIFENGKRVFSHNNCLPCKNMHVKDLQAVAKYYPDYWRKADDLAGRIGSYWGRSEEMKDFDGDCQWCAFS